MESPVRKTPSKTDINLWSAFIGEAKANRLYNAYAMKAMEEGYHEAAQIFLEVAGSETIHAISHLKALKEVRSTVENLEKVVLEEGYEMETMYPRMLKEAEQEGRMEAAASFRLAMEREGYHQKLFQQTLDDLRRRLTDSAQPSVKLRSLQPDIDGTKDLMPSSAPDAAREVTREKARIVATERVREVIFGAQDGIISTVALVASVTGATSANSIVIIAGLAGALGGMISMSAGSYMSSKAEKELHVAEVDREAVEIMENPAEELAELIEVYQREGMSYDEALELATRISKDPELWLKTMAVKELGLDPEVAELESPIKDSLVMGLSFIVGAIIPVLPYFVLFPADSALLPAVGLALLALFGLGAGKGKMVSKSMVRSGIEIVVIGTCAAALGYLLGIGIPLLLGIEVPQ